MIFEGKQSILKTRDLAILLDLSPDVVNDMARRGHLKGFKSGNQWRFQAAGRRALYRTDEEVGVPGVTRTPSKGRRAMTSHNALAE